MAPLYFFLEIEPLLVAVGERALLVLVMLQPLHLNLLMLTLYDFLIMRAYLEYDVVIAYTVFAHTCLRLLALLRRLLRLRLRMCVPIH